MNVLKNKHFVIALIIAPLLAIGAYVATDYHLKEKPKLAKAGQSYSLAAQSNCRYASGVCTLKNADIELQLHTTLGQDKALSVQLESNLPLQRALIAFSKADQQTEPQLMQVGADSSQWQITSVLPRPEDSVMRLVVLINNASYFVETPAIFVKRDTGFSQQNFSP